MTDTSSSPAPAGDKEKLGHEKEVCSLYIDSAKTYIQLSTGALLLSLTFSSDFLGATRRMLLSDWPLVAAWVFWLLTVLVGVTYQYCAIKYLETEADAQGLLLHPRSWPVVIPKSLRGNPFVLYGVMMAFFYLGIIVFTCVAVSKVASADGSSAAF